MAQNWNEWITSLYNQEYRGLYRVAYRLTGNKETAKELTQDAFLWALLHKEGLMTHPRKMISPYKQFVNIKMIAKKFNLLAYGTKMRYTMFGKFIQGYW